jgi:hypothetical protein
MRLLESGLMTMSRTVSSLQSCTAHMRGVLP